MAINQLWRVLQSLDRAHLPEEVAGQTDGQLLDSYLRTREQAALAALVCRHGPMVWGVCRRILLSHHDAEDAFQATFLVLVRKAASVVPRDMVANWIYGVAHQTALKARATAAKRSAREKQVSAMPEPAVKPSERVSDLPALLDQELSRLPAKYRAVIVLCDLEGKTRKQAAQHFRVPEGTVASRLATARTMLAKRLTRQGLALSGAALTTLLSQQAASAGMPRAVASAAIQAAELFAAGQTTAPGVLSVQAVTLADAVLKSMLVSKLKKATAVLVLLVLLGGAAAVAPRNGADVVAPPAPAPAGAIAEVNGDWPQWRGRNRDGVVHGVTVPALWPKTLTEEWRAPVGEGVASPVVADGRVYVFTRENDNEVVRCLDLAAGTELWRSEPYPARYNPRPEERGFSKGPRATPAVAAGRLYTMGMSGMLSCFDASTGSLGWRRDCKATPIVPPAPAIPDYGGSSPLIADALCVIHVGDGTDGGLTAFDARTGERQWCFAEGYNPTSGSPILVDLAGERQFVTYAASHAVGVSAATGKKLWSAGAGGAGPPHTTPLRYKDLLILNDVLQPLRAVRLDRGPNGLTPTEVWKSKNLPLGYSSPVVVGDLVVGMSTHKNGCFFCLDANTGATLWETNGREGDYASIVNAGSVLLFLTEKGCLKVVKPSAAAYEPLAEYHVSDTDTHAHPVFLGDRILIKDGTTLRSWRITSRETAEARPSRWQAVDLQPYANQKLKEPFGPKGNDLAGLSTGEQTLAGVKFHIGAGLVQLAGNGLLRPKQVEGIKVGRKFTTLHMLHATQWGPDKDEPVVVGAYTVNYEGHTPVTIPLIYGEDIRNWWTVQDQPPPRRAEVAWKGTNEHARESKSTLNLYLSKWKNPEPARTVASIDFVATHPQVAPFCVALTVQE
jgi:RNA polymerase sigma factor (sigma-70 family)